MWSAKTGSFGYLGTFYSLFSLRVNCATWEHKFQPQSPFIDFQMSFLKLRQLSILKPALERTKQDEISLKRVTGYQKDNNFQLHCFTASIGHLQVHFLFILHNVFHRSTIRTQKLSLLGSLRLNVTRAKDVIT